MKRGAVALLSLLALTLGSARASATATDADSMRTLPDEDRQRVQAALASTKGAIGALPAGPSRRVAEALLEDARTALAKGDVAGAEEALADAQRIAGQPTARVTVVVEGTDSRFLVKEGTVEVTSGRTTAVAGPGEMVTATAGAAPRVEKIPVAPPKLLQPAEAASIDWGAVLRWSRPEGAKRFQVWIARDASFQDRVATLLADGTTNPIPPDLATGVYFWRVAAVSGEGLESLPSEPRSFRVAPDPDGRLYWVRHMTRTCTLPPCPRWLAVDTESGAERPVVDVDLGLLGLDRSAEDVTRQQLLAGEVAVRGSIKPGASPDRAVLVVSSLRGVE